MKGGGNQTFLSLEAKASEYADGSRCPSTGRILSMAETGSEVLVGTVKAGKMIWRNSLKKMDAGAADSNNRVLKMGCGARCSLMAGDQSAFFRSRF